MLTLGRVSELTKGPVQSAVDMDGKSVRDSLYFIRTSVNPGPKTQ